MTLGFKDVIGDSRCPQGVQCIWEGQASVVLQAVLSDNEYNIILVEPGLTNSANYTLFQYNIVFNLEPYPQPNQTIEKGDYQLRMTVDSPEFKNIE